MSNTNIIYHRLGRNGPKVPALGFGAMGFTSFYGSRMSDDESHEVLKEAVEAGCALIDTNLLYGMGENERLLGSLLKDSEFRSKVFICTKFGTFITPEGEFGISGKPEYAGQCCEESLKIFRWITLIFTIRTGEEIRRAHAIAPISALQIEFSPFTPDIRENGLLDTCRELGIAIIAYSPLGRGFLTGAYKSVDDFEEGDFRRNNPRFQGEAFKENLKLVDALKEIADKKGVTPSQLTLAWVLSQGDDFFAIPGTKKIKYLQENVSACDVKLTQEDISSIEEILNRIKVIGDSARTWFRGNGQSRKRFGRLSAFYGNRVSDDESREVLRAAVEAGCTFIDTSNVYGPPMGKNEELIGSLLKDPAFRSKVFICTKFGAYFSDKGGLGCNGTPEYVRKCCEELRYATVLALSRGGSDYNHRGNLEGVEKLKEEGKVRYLGISEATVDEIRRAHAVTPTSAAQIEGEAFKENLKLVDALKEIADEKGVTASQLTLAWVFAQGDDIFAIPGTKKIKYLKENIGSRDVQLTNEDFKAIDDILERIKVVGERYTGGASAAGTAF
ncbi:Aldo-keto reductase yakc [NADP(+)] [Serendipita indica DSM 11827]|nr:Aldo-keto reductase yakc [NADP(+)] [Serendipita indica DSM 11827]